jgi:fatty-acyl-CoA synthase
MQSSLFGMFRAVAEAVPDRECLVHRSVRRDYRATLERAQRLAALLAARGLGVRAERAELAPHESGQDHIALLLHNCPEYFEGLLGALAARVAPVNVNYRYTVAELRYLLLDASPAAVMFHAQFGPALAAALDGLPVAPLLLCVDDGSGTPPVSGAIDYEGALAAASPGQRLPEPSPDDLIILYTGGTTGKPKGTLWRNGDMIDNLAGLRYPPGTAPADAVAAVTAATGIRTLGSAPFMHATGTWGAVRALVNGGMIAIPDESQRYDPAAVCAFIDRERLDYISLVGEAFCRPLADELDRGGYDVSCVRTILLGGVATREETKRRLLTHMPDAVISESVGSSETMAVINQQLTAATAAGQAQSAVFALLPRGCVLALDRSRLLAPGEQGDGYLAARAPLPLGYLGDPDKTAATFPQVGGERLGVPGDMLRMRADGRVELLGRTANTINTGGEKVHAEEVERALLGHPAVRDVLVLGRASERWGQEVVALVQLDAAQAGIDDQELREHAARDLARYKLPKAFVRVAEVRRTATGKADYGWARTALDGRSA